VALDDANSHWSTLAGFRHARSRSAAPVVSPWQRGTIALVVALLHAWLFIAARSQDELPAPSRDAIEVVFISNKALVDPVTTPSPPPLPTVPRAAGAPAKNADQSLPDTTTLSAGDSEPSGAVGDGPAATSDAAPQPRLFLSDGAIALPHGVVEDLQAALSDDRQFDYRRPGLDDAGKLFGRRSAIEMQTTRFAAGWIEQKDLGTSVLESAFKATSVEVKLGRNATCVASLFGMVACSWGRVGYVAELDDPTTLDIDEAAHCHALWERIVDAVEQQEWRRLRSEYETECRKPLAADKAPPLR
jgi:hypothetical protein